MGGKVKPGIEFGISYSDTMLNYPLSQKLKLLENCEFNHLIISLTKIKGARVCKPYLSILFDFT